MCKLAFSTAMHLVSILLPMAMPPGKVLISTALPSVYSVFIEAIHLHQLLLYKAAAIQQAMFYTAVSPYLTLLFEDTFFCTRPCCVQPQ
jgi:hypothetical protein